jgi:hypothetical protein
MARRMFFYVYKKQLWGGFFEKDLSEVKEDKRLLKEEVIGVRITGVLDQGNAVVFIGEKP